jgi:hypothetical protein
VTDWYIDADGDGALDTLPVGAGTHTVYGIDDNGNAAVAGTILVAANGNYTYTPCTDTLTPVTECGEGAFTGTLLVDYTIEDDNTNPAEDSATLTIQVLAETDELISGLASPPEVNDPPVAGDDLALAYFETAQTGNWLANDSDPNGDSLTLGYAFETPIATAEGGSIVFHADGTFTYTPPDDYIGPDQLTYTICDDGSPSLCDVATIYLVVLPGMDFGDLPENLVPTSLPPHAPAWGVRGTPAGRHFIIPGLRLGASVDAELEGVPSDLTDGDGADEDSTTYAAIGFDDGDGELDPDLGETAYYKLGVLVQNDTGEDAVLVGYIDWNCDGTMNETNERARVVVNGDGNLATVRDPLIPECDISTFPYCALEWGTINGDPLMSKAAADNCNFAGGEKRTYARLRLTTEPEFFSNNSPRTNGKVKDGEIEDGNIVARASSTPAMVADFTATQHVNGGAVIAWTTASELGSVAFRVERLSADAEGSGSRWVRIHEADWLPSRLEIQGSKYQVFDAGAEQGGQFVYRIIERINKGGQLTYGPYKEEIAAGAEDMDIDKGYSIQERYDYDRVVANLETRARARADVKARASASTKSKTQSQTMAKKDKSAVRDTLRVELEHTGIHGLTVQELVDAFESDTDQVETMLRRGEFRLTSRGQEIPWFEQDGVLYFYGEGSDNRFSATRTYWLYMKQAGTVMSVFEAGNAGEDPVPESFEDTRDHEVDDLWWLSATTDPESDYWFWNKVNTGPGETYILPVPGAQELDGELKLRLWGAFDVEREVTVKSAGMEIGSFSFSGNVEYETPILTLDAELFTGDTLELEITTTGGSVLVDGFEVTWQRDYHAKAGALEYPADGATRVTGFDSDQVVTMDVTVPTAPLWVAGGATAPDGAGFVYTASLLPGEYASMETSQVLKPASMELDDKSDLRNINHRADYVVISHAELMDAADALAQHHRPGLKTMVVDIRDIYDEFTAGEPLPSAINQFAKASQSWKTAPRYFAILGDGSFDYRDIMGTGYNFISPQMYGTSNGLFASDTLLGDIDEDGIPELAFGRIPVKSNAEGLAYVSKLANYESGIGELPSLLLTDISDKGGDFTYSQLQVEEQIKGSTININLQKTDIASARDELDFELAGGVRMINYLPGPDRQRRCARHG